MGLNIPKQFYMVGGQPIIMYSVSKFASCPEIDSITIVLADQWRSFVEDYLAKVSFRGRFFFAVSGESRQHSVLNGLNALKGFACDDDLVFVHDAVRPLFPVSNIYDGLEACREYDAALPVISVKDATYQSRDGKMLTAVLPREELFSGQSPECFVYGRFMSAHNCFSSAELDAIRGCSELMFRAGMTVKLIPGTEQNYKITTIEDLKAFELTCGPID